jgi:hypothetical protein
MMPGYERELRAALYTLREIERHVRMLGGDEVEDIVDALATATKHVELAVHFALGFSEKFAAVPTVLDLEDLREEALRARAGTVHPPIYYGVLVPGNVLLELIERASHA